LLASQRIDDIVYCYFVMTVVLSVRLHLILLMCLLIVKLWLDEPTVSADSFGRRHFRPRLIGLSGRLVLVNKKPRKLIINMKMYWLRNRSVFTALSYWTRAKLPTHSRIISVQF